MFYFRRPESPGIQLAVSKSKQEVMPRVTSGELLPTDEIFDSEHKTWLPLYEWLAIASPAVPIQPTTETEKEHTQPHDTVLQKSQPNAAAKETILPNHKRSTNLELPSQIGRYSIIKELGSGGMGTVYKVQDEMKDERALKVMHPEFANNPTFAQMFVDEGRRARKFTVNSRRLVTTYDVGRVDDTLYLSLELVNWPTLLEVMPKIREKGWRGVVALFTEIAMGLEDLHIEKVVHRDLKPGNVFVDAESYFNSTGDKQWKVKLADFGLSGEVDEASKMATSYRAAGTAYYMAPEQRKGEHWTPASDIYSFGVMFYEALTGDIPQGMFEPASQLCKDLPTSFDELISKCLATKLENRIQNGESLAKEIKKQLSATQAKVEIPKTAQATESQSEPNLEPKSETSTQTVQNTNTTSPSAPPFVVGESKNPSTTSTTSNQEASKKNSTDDKAERATRKTKQFEEPHKKQAVVHDQKLDGQQPIKKNNTIVGEANQLDIQSMKPNPVIQLPSQRRAFFAIVLAVVVLLAISVVALNSTSTASNYKGLEMRLNTNYSLILDELVRERLKKDADSGDSTAQGLMAWCLQSGRGGFQKNELQAFTYAQQSASAKDGLGMEVLGWHYGFAKDNAEAIKWWQKSAETGNSVGMCTLADIFQEGLFGLNKDPIQAAKWYKKSAEAGNTVAMWRLGKLYEDGPGGLAKDIIEAVKWYRKAADLGDIRATNSLESVLKPDFISPVNPTEEWAKNLIVSDENIWEVENIALGLKNGKNPSSGLPVPKNEYLAKILFEKMHAQCPGNGTFTRIYSKLIISVDANKQLAFSVLLNGERDIDGDFQLAEYYEKGIGTDINKDEAKKLYSQIANAPYYPELARKAKEKLRSLG